MNPRRWHKMARLKGRPQPDCRFFITGRVVMNLHDHQWRTVSKDHPANQSPGKSTSLARVPVATPTCWWFQWGFLYVFISLSRSSCELSQFWAIFWQVLLCSHGPLFVPVVSGDLGALPAVHSHCLIPFQRKLHQITLEFWSRERH